MDNEARIQEQVARGMTRQQACMTLGIPYTKPPQVVTVDKESLRTMALGALAALIEDIQADPSQYRAAEIIAACKEALDRTEGKAAQSLTIDTKATVTHEHVMNIPAAEAYRLLIEGSKVMTNVPVIDLQPVEGGGDTREQPMGVVVSESPTHNTTPWDDF